MTDSFTRAWHLGEQHGRNAADWLWDGNTDDPEAYLARLIAGLEDGDGEVEESLPQPDLSGQWADGLTPGLLAEYCEHDDDDTLTDLCYEYEDGFYFGRDARIYEAHGYYVREA